MSFKSKVAALTLGMLSPFLSIDAATAALSPLSMTYSYQAFNDGSSDGFNYCFDLAFSGAPGSSFERIYFGEALPAASAPAFDPTTFYLTTWPEPFNDVGFDSDGNHYGHFLFTSTAEGVPTHLAWNPQAGEHLRWTGFGTIAMPQDGMMFSTVGTGEQASFATATLAAVPEPGTYALMGAGLAIIGLIRRRRRDAIAV